jgi:hypothetical protein
MSTTDAKAAPAGTISYEAFLDWADEDTLAEWVDGKVIMTSPASLPHQQEEKFAEYQRGGVSEYWILDPDIQQAEFYQLDPQGVYQRIAPDAQGVYRAQAVPGFWLNVAWLWQNPLPGQDITLYEIIGKPYADYQREQMRQRGL